MPDAGRLDQLDLDESAEARQKSIAVYLPFLTTPFLYELVDTAPVHAHWHLSETMWRVCSEPQQNACLLDWVMYVCRSDILCRPGHSLYVGCCCTKLS